ncbi:DJ-1 family glyoxalase III [Treponema sp.]|uniref:DJ-1 family glyoxalase III n=1 Tax=Treponema sp. TaxID=166 RepID=UPI003F078677
MKKTLLLLANGFEEIEALSPADYLRRAGAEVTIAATGTSSRNVEGAHKILVTADITLDAYCSSAETLPDAIIIPGGNPGAKNISECAKAMEFINLMHRENKLIAAICAAPALVLSKTPVLEGKNWTCYPEMEKDLSAELQKNHKKFPVVSDGNLITARGPGAAEQFSMEIVRFLLGEEARRKTMEASVQREC